MTEHDLSQITHSSPQEGLDYACLLITSGTREWAIKHPEEALILYHTLTGYIEFRYHNELELALGCLVQMGRVCPPNSFQSEIFWRQLRWVAEVCKIQNIYFPETH